MPVEERKCEHGPCKCLVGGEQIFCSAGCADASAEASRKACACGHADCEESIGLPLAGALGFA